MAELSLFEIVNNEKLFKDFTSIGTNYLYRREEGNNILHLCAIYGFERKIQLLFNINFDLNLINNDSLSALILSIIYEQEKCTKLLLSNKRINTSFVDKYSKTALYYALEYSSDELVLIVAKRSSFISKEAITVLFNRYKVSEEYGIFKKLMYILKSYSMETCGCSSFSYDYSYIGLLLILTKITTCASYKYILRRHAKQYIDDMNLSLFKYFHDKQNSLLEPRLAKIITDYAFKKP